MFQVRTGAKTTVQLAANYGDSAELHVFMAAEQTATPATVNVAVTSSSPFAFDTGSGAVSTLEFVDGNTYVFDVSDASMADKTLTIGTTADDLSSALTSGLLYLEHLERQERLSLMYIVQAMPAYSLWVLILLALHLLQLQLLMML